MESGRFTSTIELEGCLVVAVTLSRYQDLLRHLGYLGSESSDVRTAVTGGARWNFCNNVKELKRF